MNHRHKMKISKPEIEMNMNSETENRKVVVKEYGEGEYPSYDMNKSGDYDIQCGDNNNSILFHT